MSTNPSSTRRRSNATRLRNECESRNRQTCLRSRREKLLLLLRGVRGKIQSGPDEISDRKSACAPVRFSDARRRKASRDLVTPQRTPDPSPTASLTDSPAYVCPMCPEVREHKPGACPSCGMALEPDVPVASTRTEYTCPMHPEIVRPAPGSVRSAAWRSSRARSPPRRKKIPNCAT